MSNGKRIIHKHPTKNVNICFSRNFPVHLFANKQTLAKHEAIKR